MALLRRSSAALAVLAASSRAADTVSWTRVLMEEDAAKDGAVCLDGSPAAYYLKWGAPSDVDKWVIHINGGGWCTAPTEDGLLKSCYDRSKTNLGSSAGYGSTADFHGFDLLNADPAVNPDFASWTSVFVMYCDGGSLSGNRAEPVELFGNGTMLYFRGARILKAVLRNLLSPQPAPGGGPSLAAASRVVLTGNSAGGLATILHADEVRAALPASVDFKALPQVGFFVDALDTHGRAAYTAEYQMVAQVQNISAGEPWQVNEACMLATPPQDRWRCFMAQYTLPFVRSPIFIQNSKLDNWQLRNILAAEDPAMIACVNDPANSCTEAQLAAFHAYGEQFLTALNQSVAANPNSFTTNGGLITSCDLHDHMIGGRWNTISVGGRTMRDIVTPWLLGKAASDWVFDGDWPSNPTCSGPLLKHSSHGAGHHDVKKTLLI